jgi:tripartite-type tricarboxylate transporter receptor subunit TctC
MSAGFAPVKCIFLSVLAFSSYASAETDPAFFQGKTITIMVGAPPGGTLDPYARLVARFLGAQIPGSPNIVISNVPGASSNVLARQLYSAVPKDGTRIGAIFQGIATEGLIGQGEGRSYDASKFSWLGSTHPETMACAVLADLPVRGPEDLQNIELILGTSSPGSPAHDFPAITRSILGVKFKPVRGYSGGQAMILALERREVEAICITWTSIRSHIPDILTSNGYARVIATSEMSPPAEFKSANIPAIASLATSELDKAALEFFYGPNAFGGPFILPPDVPADRVALLRESFRKVFESSEAAEVAKSMNLELACTRFG